MLSSIAILRKVGDAVSNVHAKVTDVSKMLQVKLDSQKDEKRLGDKNENVKLRSIKDQVSYDEYINNKNRVVPKKSSSTVTDPSSSKVK